ncbi:MAG: 16S rRNA (cytidine(1402)-2'-O)-methyltransferase [Desulfuromonadales bacterium]|nr:16S rRNA (cytidine(1402)-2'-O)-methyltransferase [Desulfuromonadales bacterium]
MTAGQHGRPGTLYVVATPIGNLEDISYRAVRLLGEVDLIAAEDTRHSRKLLNHYSIATPLISCHEHNEERRSSELLDRLQRGEDVALISDAGTPCIADPGYRLVTACWQAGLRVVPIPGASALTTVLSVAGLPTDRFAFEGYLPARAQARRRLLEALRTESRTLVMHETPHRLRKALDDIVEIMGAERPLVVGRELTKRHEELFRGTAGAAREHFAEGVIRGEIVLVLAAGAAPPRVGMTQALAERLADPDCPRSEAVRLIAREYGVPRSEVYRASLDLDAGANPADFNAEPRGRGENLS